MLDKINQTLMQKAPLWHELGITGLTNPWSVSEHDLSVTHKGTFETHGVLHKIHDLPHLICDEANSDLARFELLNAFHINGDNYFRRLSRLAISAWIDSNQTPRKNEGWDTLNVCERLKNWIYNYDFFGISAETSLQKKITKSFNNQVKYLRKLYRREKDTYLICVALQTLSIVFFINTKKRQTEFYLSEFLKNCRPLFYADGGHTTGLLSEQIKFSYLLTELSVHMSEVDYPQASLLHWLCEKIAKPLRIFSGVNANVANFEQLPPNTKHYQQLLAYNPADMESISLLKNMGYAKIITHHHFPLVTRFKPLAINKGQNLSAQQLLWQVSNTTWLKQTFFIENHSNVSLIESNDHTYDCSIDFETHDQHSLISIKSDFLVVQSCTDSKQKRPLFVRMERSIHIDHQSEIIRGCDTIKAAQSIIFGHMIHLPKNTSKVGADKQGTYIIDLSKQTKDLRVKCIFDGHVNTQHRRKESEDILIFSRTLRAETPYTFKWALKIC